jgi:hypothetical protein
MRQPHADADVLVRTVPVPPEVIREALQEMLARA